MKKLTCKACGFETIMNDDWHIDDEQKCFLCGSKEYSVTLSVDYHTDERYHSSSPTHMGEPLLETK